MPDTIFHADFLSTVRDWWDGGLTDECSIERATGTVTWDTDGNATIPDPTHVYGGPCLVQRATTTERLEDVGGANVTRAIFHAVIPHDADPIEVDDVLTVTSSADADLVGTALRVTDVSLSSVHDARRLRLEASHE